MFIDALPEHSTHLHHGHCWGLPVACGRSLQRIQRSPPIRRCDDNTLLHAQFLRSAFIQKSNLRRMATLRAALNEGDLQKYLEVALAAAKEAGKLIAAAWDQTKVVEHKGVVDLVTETDKHCEALVLNEIRRAFPDHQLIGEESSAEQGFTAALTDKPTWMVDPVDGTTNFVHRFPFSCVSIGLSISGKVVVGVVYNPILGELFYATRGGGAFLNDRQVRCSTTSQLQQALFATELGTRRDDAFLDAVFGRMRALAKETRSIRACGSCALNLCSVAMGRLDAYYEVGLGGPWDVAAASLIVEEAGGVIMDPCGGAFNLMSCRVLGTNRHLARPVSAILAKGPWAADEPQP